MGAAVWPEPGRAADEQWAMPQWRATPRYWEMHRPTVGQGLRAEPVAEQPQWSPYARPVRWQPWMAAARWQSTRRRRAARKMWCSAKKDRYRQRFRSHCQPAAHGG